MNIDRGYRELGDVIQEQRDTARMRYLNTMIAQTWAYLATLQAARDDVPFSWLKAQA